MLRKAAEVLLSPLPYFLNPRSIYEARFGKAVLLTDAELGIILTALRECNIQNDEEAVACLFPKLLETLGEECPYESLPIATAGEDTKDEG